MKGANVAPYQAWFTQAIFHALSTPRQPAAAKQQLKILWEILSFHEQV
jgi:hypothetical protein